MSRKEFIEKQIQLIEITTEILKKSFENLKRNDPEFLKNFGELFYEKSIPPHIMQPLNALECKLAVKPAIEEIAEKHNISGYEARKLLKKYGFREVFEKGPLVEK